MAPILTIGMATFRDYFGLWGTLMRLQNDRRRLGLVDEVEIVVVDNEPNGTHGKHNANLVGNLRNAQYIPFGEIVGTSAPRNKVFEVARGEFVCCIDAHVELADGAATQGPDGQSSEGQSTLRRLVEFCRGLRDATARRVDGVHRDDLFHGPLVGYDQEHVVWTHWADWWGDNGMLGKQRAHAAAADPEHPPLKIALAGLGLFLARRESWLGFDREQRHFGGEEGGIHELYRAEGRQVLLLSFLRWVHRFRLDHQAEPIPFATDWLSRCRNYLLWHRRIGYPSLADIKANHVNGQVAQVQAGGPGLEPRTTQGRISVAEWRQLLRDMGLSETSPVPRKTEQPQPAPVTASPAEELRLLPELQQLQRLPCRHRGRQIGTVLCEVCGHEKGQFFPQYRCAAHGTCSLVVRNPAVSACATCPDRSE